MCLNLPFEVQNQLTFKWDGSNILFVIQYIRSFKIILYDSGLGHERVKMGKKWRKMLSPTYSLKFKNIILFLNRGLYFFSNGHIRNVVSTLPNVVKIDVENDNVVSTLSNVVQFNVEKHNVVSTLFYVVNFNVDIHNVVSTLIWRCATSRRHINLKTTLNRRWNVCWESFALFYRL